MCLSRALGISENINLNTTNYCRVKSNIIPKSIQFLFYNFPLEIICRQVPKDYVDHGFSFIENLPVHLRSPSLDIFFCSKDTVTGCGYSVSKATKLLPDKEDCSPVIVCGFCFAFRLIVALPNYSISPICFVSEVGKEKGAKMVLVHLCWLVGVFTILQFDVFLFFFMFIKGCL